MLEASFENRGDSGTLCVITHFGRRVEIECHKNSNQDFKLGGTGISELACYQGVILQLPTEDEPAKFRAFITEENTFEGSANISPEVFRKGDACFVIEYYPLDMEGNKPEWILCKNPINEKYPLFINLFVLDGGGNSVKTYRLSPFTGEHVLIGNDG